QVAFDLLVGTLERVPPAATAGGADPDDLAGPDELGIGQRVDVALIRAAGIDRHLERRTGLAALDAPAGEDRAVRDGHEVRVLEHAQVLLVAQSAAVAPGATAVDGEPEALDDEREAALGELGRQVAAVGDDVDGVLTVGVVAAARATAEDLPH